MWSHYSIIRRNLLRALKSSYSSYTAAKIRPTELIPDAVQKFKPDTVYHGFKLKSIDSIPEFRMYALCMEHVLTGAQYLHLYRDDSNNVFAVSFRTTPKDSTGAPHILEHTVLCGSQLFPVRDPFFKMLNRSLATFMNAMTGPDYTFYPFSTQNKTDFKNLQKIYLDAVFRPNINLLDFMQEGWRLEHADPVDKKSDIIIKGVVYNEMKGALAENEQILNYKLLNTLLPDHTYGHVSGGDPFAIPNLTWQQLKEFHKNHYHPSNARFYSYGNFPLLPSLEYINQEYLSKYEKINISHTEVPLQPRWKLPKRVIVDCRFENLGQPIENQHTLAISYAMSSCTDIYNTFVLQFITELLVRGPNSPFYKTLVEPKISGGFTPSTGFDNQTRDTIFTLGLQGLRREKFDTVIRIFDQTLDDVILKGFASDHIESVLHRYELGIKHQSVSFGLNLLFGLIPTWNHDGDVVKTLKINSLISDLKQNIKSDPNYLQNYVKKYFKDNKHKLIVTMSPDTEYEKIYASKEEKLLKNKLKQLAERDKEEIFASGLKLQSEQTKRQNIDLLPTLQITDINSDIIRNQITKSSCGTIPTQLCRVNTNGITYFQGILNATELTPEQMMMLPLFCYVINKLGTEKLNHLEFDSLVNRKTGGLNFGLHIGESLHQLHTHEPGIEISSYCLDRNAVDMWDLWLHLFSLTELRDVKRFEMLVQLYMANLTHGIIDFGHVYAMSAAAGIVSGSSYQKDQLTGLQHIAYMKNLICTSNYGAMLQELSKIGRILFDKNKLRCALNVSNESVDSVFKSYEKFIQSLPGTPQKSLKSSYVTPKVWLPIDSVHCQHHVLNIPVYYCSKSVLTVPYADPKYAKLRVLAKLISAKYLHPELREKHGAYGGGAKLAADGVFTFYSYRDPRHLPTLDVFDQMSAWLRSEIQIITAQDLLEAKLGVFQSVDAPEAPCQRGLDEFLKGLTPDLLQRHRAEIMSTDVKQLAQMGDEFFQLKNTSLQGKVILGPKAKDFETSKRKRELWTVMSADER